MSGQAMPIRKRDSILNQLPKPLANDILKTCYNPCQFLQRNTHSPLPF